MITDVGHADRGSNDPENHYSECMIYFQENITKYVFKAEILFYVSWDLLRILAQFLLQWMMLQPSI